MTFGQPFKIFMRILVGKSHCLEAINNFKNMSLCLGKSFSQQCRLHTSEKFKEILQSYSFYTRIWGEEMTFQILSVFRRSLLTSGRVFLLSAVCLMPYNWKEHKIPDEALESCVTEFESVDELCKATVHCNKCFKRQMVDVKVKNVDYCTCEGNVGYVDKNRTYDSWEPFLERQNILVWRRRDPKQKHLYSYKVYGTYDDMSLNSFMEVQLNTSFRTHWDTSALQLKVIDSDPESNSDLLYWLVKFPHFFSNRDYLFKRRFKVNERKKEVVIFSEIVEYSQVPEKQGIHRVKEYWSIMVLRSHENFNKPGMSYTLTYFDNPGTSLPAAVTNFVASTAFPDFLKKVYEASMNLQRRWENGEDVYVTLPPKLRYQRRHSEEPVDEIPSQPFPSSGPIEPQDSVAVSQKYTSNFSNETNQKIPLRFKKVVIDLLEAIEVVSPEYEEKSILTEKIEKLVDKMGITKNRKQKLVKKLETLSNRTKLFMEKAAEKKEESLKIMNEIERKHYYDNVTADEPNILYFQGLLIAINEILKVDKDMRTGKDLSRTESNKYDRENSENSNGNNTSTKFDSNYNDQNSCECCRQQIELLENVGWFNYYVTSLLSSSPRERTCICNHDSISPNHSNNMSNSTTVNTEEENENFEQNSYSWFYFPWIFGSKTEEVESTENDDEERVSWHIWTLIYKFMFRENV